MHLMCDRVFNLYLSVVERYGKTGTIIFIVESSVSADIVMSLCSAEHLFRFSQVTDIVRHDYMRN